MEIIFCDICKMNEETGSLELYSDELNNKSESIEVKKYVCHRCAEKIKDFIKLFLEEGYGMKVKIVYEK